MVFGDSQWVKAGMSGLTDVHNNNMSTGYQNQISLSRCKKLSQRTLSILGSAHVSAGMVVAYVLWKSTRNPNLQAIWQSGRTIMNKPSWFVSSSDPTDPEIEWKVACEWVKVYPGVTKKMENPRGNPRKMIYKWWVFHIINLQGGKPKIKYLNQNNQIPFWAISKCSTLGPCP